VRGEKYGLWSEGKRKDGTGWMVDDATRSGGWPRTRRVSRHHDRDRVKCKPPSATTFTRTTPIQRRFNGNQSYYSHCLPQIGVCSRVTRNMFSAYIV
jgi:uncharacterized protein (DUF2235 family)